MNPQITQITQMRTQMRQGVSGGSVRVLVVIVLLLVAMAMAMPVATVTCNPEPTFWPSEITGPEEWGIPCPEAVLEYTVYGRVTVGEDVPLEGAEVRVNRIAGGGQTGAGAALSDAAGEYRICVAGPVEALRIYVIYPVGCEAWGVTSPVGSWGLEVVHWPNPPAMCGPILWKATCEVSPVKHTVTPTSLPTSTPVPSPTHVPTLTPVPSPMPTGSFYLVVPPALRMTPAATCNERQEQIVTVAVYAVNLLRLWTYIVAAVAGLGVAQNIIKWKDRS